MTRWLTIGATLVSIAAIGLVLLLGTTGRAGTPPFEAAVLVLNVATPLASLLLTWHLWRDGHRRAAILSSTPVILMVVVTAMALGGTVPPLSLLLWLDLYVLLVFAALLGRFGWRLPPHSRPARGLLWTTLLIAAALPVPGLAQPAPVTPAFWHTADTGVVRTIGTAVFERLGGTAALDPDPRSWTIRIPDDSAEPCGQ